MFNKYTIPRRFKKAEVDILQKDRNEMYKEMNNTIDKKIGLTLEKLYEYEEDDYLIGIHRTNSDKDDFLSKGIIVRSSSPELSSHVQVFHNFPFMLREIKYCEGYKMSTGCFIVKVPKKDVQKKYINETTEPIYYKDEDGHIRLRPEFVVAYVPVSNRELIDIELNNKCRNIYNENTEFFYEDEILNELRKSQKI